MANRYPGYCTDCGREVRAGHGELIKRDGKYLVSCGKGKPAAAPKPVEKPKAVAPEGMRLTGMRLSSSNPALTVAFGVNGIGNAYTSGYSQHGTAIKYTRWSNEPMKYTSRPEDAGKSIREIDPAGAAAHDAACDGNEALYAALQAQGQIAYDSRHEYSFPLSADEHKAIAAMIADAKAAMLSAILDGSAEVRVGEVGCDYPHDQILEIKVGGEKQEYALIQTLLGEFSLKVDGSEECKDLAAAIRHQQEKQAERARKLQEHRERRANGYHVVVIRQCWECGRTQILGELDDNMHEVRMPADVYAECVREQKAAHARSLATVPEGTLLSSVGFEPEPESKFQFHCVESDWYCGC
jgi:hypothetical protein